MTDIEKIRAEAIRRNSGNDDTQGYAWGWAIPTLIREVDRLTRWRAIETAPKDGTIVIVIGLDGGALTYACAARYASNGWFRANHGDFTVQCNPTHWVPMPAHPLSR
jgi:hypothetical protein